MDPIKAIRPTLSIQPALHAAIPSSRKIFSPNVSEMLTIMGFSAYSDPMTPIDINSASSQAATLDRLTATLKQMQGYSEAYGKYTSGLFAGQYKLQGAGGRICYLLYI